MKLNCFIVAILIAFSSFLYAPETSREAKIHNSGLLNFIAYFTNPTGGEIWTGGTTHEVSIVIIPYSPIFLFYVYLYYTTDNVNYVYIDEYPQAPLIEEIYDWDVPRIDSNTVKLRAVITDGSTTQTIESNVFSIDSTPPSVVSTNPQNGATDVDPSIGYIEIVFNEMVDTQSGLVSIDNNAQTGSWSWSGNTLRVSVSNLKYGSYYNVTVSGFRDLSDPGNVMSAPYRFSFRTKYDILRNIRIESPNGGERWSGGHPHRILVEITGGTPPFTLDFYLSTDGGQTYPIYIGREIVNHFYYSKYWIVNLTDTNSARVKVVVRDNIGNVKEDTSDGDFFIDSTAPRILSYYPLDGSDTVPKNAYIYLNFSESMNKTSVESGFSLEMEGGGNVSGNFSWTSDSSLVFIPDSPLLTDTKYYLNITNAKDISDPGNVMPQFSISFVTEPIIGISILYPTVGLRFSGGATIPINWKIRGGNAPYNITVYFSTDGGQTYNEVLNTTQSAAGTGSCTLTLPKIDSNSCKIKLKLVDSSGNSTESEMRGNFAIDSTAPQVLSIVPARGSTDVSVRTNITIVFSEEMNKTSVQSSLTVEAQGRPIQGTIKWLDNTRLVFIPSTPLEMNTTYWINITAAKDTSQPGNLMPFFSSYFKTYPKLITKFISPRGGERWTGGYNQTLRWNCAGGKPGYKVNILYSKDGGANYVGYVVRDYSCGAGENSYSWLIPKINTTSFKLKIEIYDSDYNREVAYSESLIVDSRSPSVVLTSPKDGETEVSPESVIEVYFSEEMNRTSVMNSFSVESGGKRVAGVFEWDTSGRVVKFKPSDGMFKTNSVYWVNITRGAKDNSTPGNNLEKDITIRFETIRTEDRVPPRIVRVFPYDGMKGVPLKVDIEIEFSEKMHENSVKRAFKIVPAVNGTFLLVGKNLTYRLSENLKCNTTYTVIISSSAMDVSYNSMESEFRFQFTTVSSEENSAVYGYVVNSTYKPIANASIQLTKKDGSLLLETQSNDVGYFWIGDVSPGEYNLTLKREGYKSKTLVVKIKEGSIVNLGKIILDLASEDGSEGGEEIPDGDTPTKPKSSFNWLIVVLAVVAVLAVVIIFVVVKMKPLAKVRKKDVCVSCGEKIAVGNIVYRCPECKSIMHAKCSKSVEFCPGCGKEVKRRVTVKRESAKMAEKMFSPPVCKVCGKEFVRGEMGYKCSKCGKIYHVSCISGASACSCGKEFPSKLKEMSSNKTDENKEKKEEKSSKEEFKNWLSGGN